eukprot:scaffold208403_cov30-Tisochrysis_lutea.AAC.3
MGLAEGRAAAGAGVRRSESWAASKSGGRTLSMQPSAACSDVPPTSWSRPTGDESILGSDECSRRCDGSSATSGGHTAAAVECSEDGEGSGLQGSSTSSTSRSGATSPVWRSVISVIPESRASRSASRRRLRSARVRALLRRGVSAAATSPRACIGERAGSSRAASEAER